MVSPKAAALFCRSTLENAINWIYDHDAKLNRPWCADLSILMHEYALASLKYLFRFMRYLAIDYGETLPETQLFDEKLIPKDQSQVESKHDVQAMLAEVVAKNKAARKAEDKQRELAAENKQLQQQLAAQREAVSARKIQREQTIDIDAQVPLLVSEAQTRRRYIDVSLKESGRDIKR
ncbi:MAG: hypothetical protein HFP78_00685 [Methylococcales symbiont of Hymedesmia sp. n. MRB-2018]|nr:MAG: hypothetical protein HFP78_00685 [Methylococcales symbiont of Hymedesmia sp. n. MRB-2018]